MLTDSYKVTQYKQYPEDTKRVFSFFESRGGRYDKIMLFGLQYFIKKYLVGQVVTEEKIEEAREMFVMHFGDNSIFNENGWRYILDKHNGYLPISICAAPEGELIPTRNALITIVNTDDNCAWLTNYLETLIVEVWYPSTVASQSYMMKQDILHYLEETGNPDLAIWKLHDFGFRGSSSVESSAIGGAAHLVNFMGTDTMSALMLHRKYYGEKMAGYSIPASEHSTMTSWGRENESKAYENMLEKYPKGIISIVSDSYDIFNACANIFGEEFKEKVLGRDGVLVVRPDSGDPLIVLPLIFNILGEKFGFTYNQKGYKVLNDKIRVIQGDGIDYKSLRDILETLKQEGWSADNITFGSGGGLLQKVNRDTQKFAFKCSAVLRSFGWMDVLKDPITDSGKKSKAGRLGLYLVDGEYKTLRLEEARGENLLKEVFRNGKLLIDQTLAEIRQRANN